MARFKLVRTMFNSSQNSTARLQTLIIHCCTDHPENDVLGKEPELKIETIGLIQNEYIGSTVVSKRASTVTKCVNGDK